MVQQYWESVEKLILCASPALRPPPVPWTPPLWPWEPGIGRGVQRPAPVPAASTCSQPTASSLRCFEIGPGLDTSGAWPTLGSDDRVVRVTAPYGSISGRDVLYPHCREDWSWGHWLIFWMFPQLWYTSRELRGLCDSAIMSHEQQTSNLLCSAQTALRNNNRTKT